MERSGQKLRIPLQHKLRVTKVVLACNCRRTSASTSCQVLLSNTPVEMSPSITILTSRSAVIFTEQGAHGSKEQCNVQEEISESKNRKKASSKLQSLPFFLSCCLHAWSRPLSVASIVADACGSGGGGGEHSEGVSQSSSGTIFTSLHSYKLHCQQKVFCIVQRSDLYQLRKIPIHNANASISESS